MVSLEEEQQVEFNEAFYADDFLDFVSAFDVGGTKTRAYLYGRHPDDSITLILRVPVITENTSSILSVFDLYHQELATRSITPPSRAVLGCAGVVVDNSYCHLTNTDLVVDAAEIQSRLGIDAIVINDFVANGFASNVFDIGNLDEIVPIPHLDGTTPASDPHKTRVILGPGTGLGVAGIRYDSSLNASIPLPSEGGHITWGPRNPLERVLDDYLRGEVTGGRDPDIELVASGIGLANIVYFFADTSYPINPKISDAAKKISAVRESDEFQSFVEGLRSMEKQFAGRDILEAYKEKKFDGVLRYAVYIFVENVAVAARDAWMSFQATGGVFVTGGNARRLKKQILSGTFMNVFDNPVTHSEKIRMTGVYDVIDRYLGAKGCAWLGFQKEPKRYLR